MHPIITLTGGDSAPPGAKTFSIYFIEHMDSFHVYVGQSCDPARRWSQHRGKLDCGIHYNPHLQAAWAKYGPDAFSFTVIESFGSIAEMNEAERFWESYLQFLGLKLYNLQPCGNGWLKGPETRRKIGDNSVRWWQDPTYRGKQVKAHTGKVQPREAVAKMVAAQSGRRQRRGVRGGRLPAAGNPWHPARRLRPAPECGWLRRAARAPCGEPC